MSVLSVDEIRSRFPALERRHAGVPVAYFDAPGGTQVPRSVAHAVQDYLLRHNANVHWPFPTSVETDRILEEARAAAADLVGGSPAEIAFGANMTTLTYHVSRALGREMNPGDEVVVTELDHWANVEPWRALGRELGVRIRSVPFRTRDGTLDMGALDDAVTERTRLVAVGAASNALGTINDVAGAARIARSSGALLYVDAVHLAPHEPVDVEDLGCDFLACSAYKFYGPHVGVLWVREHLIRRLDVPRLACATDEPPERLETGTLNHEGIAGTAAAIDFLASLADGSDESAEDEARPGDDRRSRLESVLTALRDRGGDLVGRLWSGLSGIPGVKLFGPPPEEPRTPTVAFTVEGIPSVEVARRLADGSGLFLSHGDFYAAGVTRALGLAEQGLVRAGCACYTTVDEVERLVDGVRGLARRGG